MPFYRLLPLFLLLTALTVKAEDYDKLPDQKSRTFYQLRGPVQTVTEVRWAPAKDTTIFAATTVIPVDDKVYTMENTATRSFTPDGNMMTQLTEEYSGKKKNRIKMQSRTFSYREGRLVALSTLEDEKPADSVEFHYRKKGQMDYYRTFDSKGRVTGKVDYTYKNGMVFSMRKKDAEQLPVSTVKYKYKDDHLVETQHFDAQSRRVETRKYSYRIADGHINDSYSALDDKGILKEGLLLIKDTTGMLLERNVVGDEREVTEYNGFQYNSRKDAETEKVFNAMIELTITNRYTYDEQDNWTRKEVFYNGILNAVVLRTITYFGKG